MSLIQTSALSREPACRAKQDMASGRPRLLLVEDEDALRKVLVRGLSLTFDVTAAADGVSAADLLADKPYDVVLSDIGLPGMSGVELLRRVRARDLDVPVVLMTGHPSLETAIAALELGAFTYVQKPCSNGVLTATLVRAAKLGCLARARREAVTEGAGVPDDDRAALNACLDRALDGLYLVFQPIVDRRSQKTIGFEALMRTKEASMPRPDTLLEAAERLDRLHEVGRRVRELAAIGFQPPDDGMTLFVNLHPADFLDSNLYDRGAPLTRIADRVVLEITEHAALDEVTRTRHRAAELRQRGFRLAIDDLGAGYAGLATLATLEPEIVKLDMSLIRGLEAAPLRRRIVESMTKLCHDLEMRVVAEGIESMPELDCIAAIGCDYLQGYFLGRPGPTLTPSSRRW